MTALLLALLASVSYGVSDFFGGLAARRRGTVTATAAVYAAATAIVLLSLAVLPWRASPEALLAGTLAGVFAIVGFVAFYAALAIGPMGVLSPTIALVNAVVPVAAALLLGESLGALGWVGLVLALGAGVLVAAEPRGSTRVSPRGLLLALVAGILLGASIIALDAAPKDSGALPAVLDTAVGLVLILPLVALLRRGAMPGWLRDLDAPDAGDPMSVRALALVAGAGGALLAVSNLLIVLALQSGQLAIVSVLVSLYPVVTVVLAAIVLRERLAAAQLTGVGLALAAAVLLALD